MSQQQPVQQAPSNGLGTAGFVISLIGFLTCGLICPLGLLLSFFGMLKPPRGLAIAGTILGGIGSLWLFLFGFAIIAGLVGLGAAVDEAAKQAQRQMEERVGAPPLEIDSGVISEPTSTPQNTKYTIINEDVLPPSKRSIDVRLNEKISEEQLQALAVELKTLDARTFERTFICYYLPDMVVGSGAWATTHFNPDLEVRIIGLSAEEEKALRVNAEDDPSRQVVGSWLDDEHPMPSKITLFRREGQLHMERAYRDGSVGETACVERPVGEFRVFMEKDKTQLGTHDFYFINSRSNLETWSLDIDDTYGSGPVFTANKVSAPDSALVASSDSGFAVALKTAVRNPTTQPGISASSSEVKSAETNDSKEDYREWTDTSGKFKVKAVLLGRLGDTVRLKKEDGEKITVPVEKLCDEDRKFLEDGKR